MTIENGILYITVSPLRHYTVPAWLPVAVGVLVVAAFAAGMAVDKIAKVFA